MRLWLTNDGYRETGQCADAQSQASTGTVNDLSEALLLKMGYTQQRST